jgi:hypothetical protein
MGQLVPLRFGYHVPPFNSVDHLHMVGLYKLNCS